jgi:hypothetical protein
MRRSQKYMPAELWAQVKQMLTPESIAIMAGVTTAWAVSHFFGVGEIADAVLLVVGGIALGGAALQAGEEVVQFALTANGATTDGDLDRAGEHFGKAVAIGGVTLILALFFRAKPKVMRDMAFGHPVPMPAGPGPRNGRFFYKPSASVGSIEQQPGVFRQGVTNIFGDITIESRLSQTGRAFVLLHEKVHAILTPKFYGLRNVRVTLRMEGYNRSYLLRYFEEAIAESNALLRTKGLGSVLESISFPVKNGYVTVAKMGQEVYGILLGPVNVGGTFYRVFFHHTGAKK